MTVQEPLIKVAESAGAMVIDARIGKPTVQILNGDGLKMPTSIPSWLAVCYPPLWLTATPDQNETLRIKKKTECYLAWKALALNRGAIFVITCHREKFEKSSTNASKIVLSPAPLSKEEWLTEFASIFEAVNEIVVVALGFAAAVAFERRLKERLREHNLIDIEDALLAAEVARTPITATASTTSTTSVKDTQLIQRMAALEAENAVLREEKRLVQARGGGHRGFRGRAQGRGTGNRGRGMGRSSQGYQGHHFVPDDDPLW